MMSPMHWIIVVLVVLLVFGAGRLGEVGKGLGDGIRNFKKGLSGDPNADDEAAGDPKQLKDPKPSDSAAQPEEKKEKV
jgi:sec-independent protein translocase protein TatA